jgi:RimJ/RimL family protein N-acetyltransferase
MIVREPPRCPLQGIALRRLVYEDLPHWYAYLSDPSVIEHTSWDLRGPETLAALLRRYECEDPAAPLRFAIIDERLGSLLGTIGLHTISLEHRSAELAYDLARPAWGRGIATAACGAVTAWSYTTLGLLRLQATVLDTNVRSERVLLKCGFAFEGLLRAYRQVRGAPGNFKMYARLAGRQELHPACSSQVPSRG